MTDAQIERAALKALKKCLDTVKTYKKPHKHTFGQLVIPKDVVIRSGGICYGGEQQGFEGGLEDDFDGKM